MVDKTLVFLCIVYGVLTGIAPAGESMTGEMIASGDEISSPFVHVFYLKPTQGGEVLELNVPLDEKEVEFTKEPDLGKGKIYKKILQIGKDEKTFLPFAWNKTQGKLYIDFNRNLDLTDDPNNMFIASHTRYFQNFQNIPIILFIKDHPVTYHLNMITIFDMRGTNVFVNVDVDSSWQGEIDLLQLKARMTVFDDLDGEINLPRGGTFFSLSSSSKVNDKYTLVPLSFKDQPSSYTAGSFHSFTQLPISSKLHINGNSYKVGYEFEKQGEDTLLKVSFKEAKPDFGTLRLPGQYIKELILYGEYQVLLFSPSPEARIPWGSYTKEKILLQKPGSSREFSTDISKGFFLNKDEVYEFRAGAPLKSLVKINPFWRPRITLEYQLLGIGEEEYTGFDSLNPPRFEIYKGDKKIFADKFQFG